MGVGPRHIAWVAVVASWLGGCGLLVGIEDDRSPLSMLEPSTGTLEPAFDPLVLEYDLDVAIADGTVAFTVDSDDGAATISVAGTPVMAGELSAAVPVTFDEEDIAIDVANDGATLTYHVRVHRGARFEQAMFAKASNTGESDGFGTALAISGDTLVVGAPGENSATTSPDDNSSMYAGAAYVYRLIDGAWVFTSYLKPLVTDIYDTFGSSVAIDGDVLVIGEPAEDSAGTTVANGISTDWDDNTAMASGAAWVFKRQGAFWSFDAYLKPDNTRSNFAFGTSVAVSGSTILIGAPGERSSATGVDGDGTDNSLINAGAVYVFEEIAGTWAQRAYLKASNTNEYDGFGTDVAIDGDVAVIGAPGEDSLDGLEADNRQESSGAVYVMHRTDGAWAQEAYVKAHQPTMYEGFGSSVDLRGDWLVAGGPGTTGVADGVAYVFERVDGAWTERAELELGDQATGGDQLGASVAIDAIGGVPTVVAGAPTHTGAIPFAGVAVVYAPGADGWFELATISFDAGEIPRLGAAVGISAGRVVIGVPGDDSGGTGVDPAPTTEVADSGAVYLYQ